MPQPDYEDDLVFPPKLEKIESLTDDWNEGTLKKGWYFVRYDNEIYPDYYNGYFIQTGDKQGLEVLAPCGYEEMQELKEKVEDLKKDLKNALWYQTVQKDEIYDLRQILKECEVLFEAEKRYLVKCSRMEDIDNILTHINGAIG